MPKVIMAEKSFLEAELEDLRTRCERVVEGSKLIACVPQVVQVKITYVLSHFMLNLFH